MTGFTITGRILLALVVVSIVSAAATSLTMFLLVTQIRADAWSSRGVEVSKIDFLIHGQLSFAASLGLVLGLIAALLAVVLSRCLRVPPGWSRLAWAGVLALPFAVAANLVCAGTSPLLTQLLFVTGSGVPLVFVLFFVMRLVPSRHTRAVPAAGVS